MKTMGQIRLVKNGLGRFEVMRGLSENCHHCLNWYTVWELMRMEWSVVIRNLIAELLRCILIGVAKKVVLLYIKYLDLCYF